MKTLVMLPTGAARLALKFSLSADFGRAVTLVALSAVNLGTLCVLGGQPSQAVVKQLKELAEAGQLLGEVPVLHFEGEHEPIVQNKLEPCQAAAQLGHLFVPVVADAQSAAWLRRLAGASDALPSNWQVAE